MYSLVTFLLLALAPLSAHGSPPPYWMSVYLPASHTNISCMFAGQPPGSKVPTLLFLHGFPEGSYMWWPVMSTGLLDNYTLVAPDMPGYNLSYTPGSQDNEFLVPAIASVIQELIASLGGQAHVVAHDWGGGVGWWLAANGGPQIRTLTILNMAHPMGWQAGVRSVEGQQRASAYVLDFIQPGFSNYLTADSSAVLQSWFAGDGWFSGSLKASLIQSWNLPHTVDAGLGWYRANIHPHCPLNCTVWECFQQGVSGTFDTMPNNGTVSGIPVRVLWGTKDTAFDTDFQLAFMATKVSPPSHLHITQYPTASHWIAQEIPETVAQEILAFIAQQQQQQRVYAASDPTPCVNDLDCSLNGVCTSSLCVCDAPWSGPGCATLAFATTTPPSAKSIYNSTDPRNTWGGAIAGPGDDSKFHAYVPLYHQGSLWHVETCLHGISSSLTGPWDWTSEANFSCGINPQFLAFPNASSPTQTLYSLWEKGAFWLSDSLYGPFVAQRQGGYSGINPAPIFFNGSFFATTQATKEIVTAPSYLGPWTHFSNITHPSTLPYVVEDPYLWVDKRGRWHILNHAYNLNQVGSCNGSHVSAHWFSEDGKDWHWSPQEPYGHTVTYEDGSTHTFATMERPYLHFDPLGNPDYLALAVDLDASESCPLDKNNRTQCCACCKFSDHDGTTVIKLATGVSSTANVNKV